MPAEKIAEVAAKSPARAHGERVLSRVVSVDEKTLHGEPCFRDTRVPVKHLFDHLRAGETLETFLTDFPAVTREQAVAVIDAAESGLVMELKSR